MEKPVVKQALGVFCRNFVTERMRTIDEEIAQIRDALAAETKSSVGDEYETGRSMLQLDLEKLGTRQDHIKAMGQMLNRIPKEGGAGRIVLGSLVHTTIGDFYLSISAGTYNSDGETIHCVSMESPIVRAILGKSAGDTAVVNGRDITILEVV